MKYNSLKSTLVLAFFALFFVQCGSQEVFDIVNDPALDDLQVENEPSSIDTVIVDTAVLPVNTTTETVDVANQDNETDTPEPTPALSEDPEDPEDSGTPDFLEGGFVVTPFGTLDGPLVGVHEDDDVWIAVPYTNNATAYVNETSDVCIAVPYHQDQPQVKEDSNECILIDQNQNQHQPNDTSNTNNVILGIPVHAGDLIIHTP